MLVVYVPTLAFEFTWDDNANVWANPLLNPVTWANLRTLWQAPYASLYVPMTYTVWAALAWLHQLWWPGPLSPAPFHGLNVLGHALNGLLVAQLLRRLLSPEHPPALRTRVAATAGALLFVVHPLQVEAVAWVSSLKDVLYGWWALLALWHYLEYARRPPGYQRWLQYGLAILTFSLALLSKPAAVMVPGLAGVLAWGLFQQPWRSTLLTLGPWLCFAI